MGLFSFFNKKKEYFSAEEKAQIVKAIADAEMQTSGEIRVYVEGKNEFVDAIDRASELFFQLNMQNTKNRNAVLLYLAIEDRQLALFADEGIYTATGKTYWDDAVKNMIVQFDKKNISSGVAACILQIGQTLKEKFPYDADTDKNELPDDIVFGK
ncbi:MAG: TPM domain-containing protein [Sphingobacteriales bacterium]|nr:TPM domain-containing protein [Sphingobacteriales bacterium]